MANFKRIKTTIPGRTVGGRRLQPSTHTIYLRLSFLALEKKRRLGEVVKAEARLEIVRRRLVAIDLEAEKLHKLGDLNMNPLPADPPQAPGSISIRY